MSIKKNFVSCRKKLYRLKTSEPGFSTLSELITLLPDSFARGAAHLLTFILSLDAENSFVSQAPATQTRVIYLNRNNLDFWEFISFWFVQSVRLKKFVSFENSWLSRLLPESPKIILFHSWNPEIPLPKDKNTQIETSFATKFFGKSKKRTLLSRNNQVLIFHVISATSPHDADMIRFLEPECPVYSFDASRILHTANKFAEDQLSSDQISLFGEEILSFVSSFTASCFTADSFNCLCSSFNPFMQLLPHAGLLGLVSLGIYECLANENKWISSTELIEAVMTLHGCLNIDDLLSISNLPESCEDLPDYFEHQIQELWKHGYLVSENSTLFTGWWDLAQDASSGQKLFALNTENFRQ
ncbi:unnamed protein product, partial [Oikopleura dioica]